MIVKLSAAPSGSRDLDAEVAIACGWAQSRRMPRGMANEQERGHMEDEMDWQPIEAALTKGPESVVVSVLLWNGVRVFAGWHSDEGWHDDKNVEWDDYPEEPQPTHWMPFPEPPAA